MVSVSKAAWSFTFKRLFTWALLSHEIETLILGHTEGAFAY